MEARLQRRVQRYGWDKAAPCYEQSWHRQLAPAQTRLLALAALRPGERVIDVACGTGLVTFAAAAAVGTEGSVVGTDISDAMVAHARTRATGITHDLRFERMDAEELTLPDATFDVALCALGLMYVPDVGKAIAEMTRVIVPGGRVVAAVWGQRSQCGWAEVFPIVDARVRSDVCPLFFALGTGDRLATVCRDAGLTDVVTERIHTRLDWASPDEACGAAFIGGPVALAYSRFDDGTRQAVHNEYLKSIEPWRSGAGYQVPGEFVIVSGRRPAQVQRLDNSDSQERCA
jgi:ubiquinone/menaquinone biosynthesis C-methylase UbiE